MSNTCSRVVAKLIIVAIISLLITWGCNLLKIKIDLLGYNFICIGTLTALYIEKMTVTKEDQAVWWYTLGILLIIMLIIWLTTIKF